MYEEPLSFNEGENTNKPLSICALVTTVEPVIAVPFNVNDPDPLVVKALTVIEDKVSPS